MQDSEPIEQVPPVAQELIDILQQVFPLRLPTRTSTEREDLFYSGQQDVILFLMDAREDQLKRAREQFADNQTGPDQQSEPTFGPVA